MTQTHDELAGVVDMFGALTRAELRRALLELAFKQGAEPDEEAVRREIEAAVDDYAIVAVDPDAVGATVARPEEGSDRSDDPDELLLCGPTAFPTLPPDADDLPHILDVERREVDRAAVGEQVFARLRGEAARAVDAGDEARIGHLLDVSYDLEAWAPVDAGPVRERLDAALEE